MLSGPANILLIRRWIRRFIIACLLTPLLIALCEVIALAVHPVFMLPALLVFAFWPAFLARGAVELVPRRAYVFAVLPGLVLLIALVTLGTILSLTFGATLYTHRARGFVLLFFDAAMPSLFTGIFVGLFTTAIWLIMPRDKPTPRFYRCAKCGYQLQGSLHAPRCPECGHVLEIGLDYPYLPHHLEALKTFGERPAEATEEEE